MKTIALILTSALATMANTLPPVPENTLPPTWEMVPAEIITSIDA